MEVSARTKRMVPTAGGVLVALQESPTEEFGGHPKARTFLGASPKAIVSACRVATGY
jgi:hypothetical protein